MRLSLPPLPKPLVPDEKESIQAVRDGDSEAFGPLVRAHQARVRLVCLIHLGNKEEADDAAQEVFIKAFEALPGFKGDSSFETWILRIADNHCRDMFRSKSRRRMESLDALLEAQGNILEGMLAKSGTDDSPPYTSD